MNRNTPFVWAWWGWEPLQFYLQPGNHAPGARGFSPEALADWYRWLHEESTVKAAADLGINCIVTHFVKGFGPEHEREEMNRTAALTEKCHRHGITVFGYLQYGSLFHETFFQERPEARNWIQVAEDGSPLVWCGVKTRCLPCIQSEEFLKYLKSCVRTGVMETGLDALHFDNFYLRPCYCPRCREAFRKETGEELPSEKMTASTPGAPLVRQWTRFRCDQLTRRMIELRDYARSLRPDILTIWNPSPIRGTLDQRLLRGTDFYDLGRNAGFLWSESGNFPETTGGTPIHQVNFFKTAEAVGYRTLSTVWKSGIEGLGLPEIPESVALVTAETAAFGAVPGNNWLMRPEFMHQLPDGVLCREWKRQIDFIRTNDDLFSGSRGKGEIALYFDRERAELDFASAYGQFLTLQQLLLQKHFPFDLVFSGQEERLEKYPLVLGAGAKEAAGHPLMTFTQAELDGNVSGTYSARVPLPQKADELVNRIRAALPSRELDVNAPETVLLERRIAADGRNLLHFINYDNLHPVRGIRICFRTPPEHLEWVSVDGNHVIQFSGNEAILPELETWATLVWEAQSC